MNYFKHNVIVPEDLFSSHGPIFHPASLFTDHAVLQCDKPVKVFGETPKASVVTVRLYKDGSEIFSSKVRSLKDDRVLYFADDERFVLTLPPQEAGKGYSMELQSSSAFGDFTKHIDDIVFGEVYLAGGQSNMEFELHNCSTGKASLENDDPEVRFYYTPKRPIFDQDFIDAEMNSGWMLFDKERAACWSAVGYYFGKELSEKLGKTVGIVGCNWGGTSASGWTEYELLEKDEDLRSYIMDYEESSKGRTLTEQKQDYYDYTVRQAAFDRKAGELYSRNPDYSWNEVCEICGGNDYPGPLNSFNPLRPAGLMETMIRRVFPYTLRGFIYYQGESDDHKPAFYQKLLTTMIINWRKLWGDETLPFIFVQLPMYKPVQDPDYKHWAVIRDMQYKVYESLSNTGLAVCLDCGAFNEIHPKIKTEVAHRLALQALNVIYKTLPDSKASAPSFEYATRNSDGILLGIKNTDGGLVINEVLPDKDNTPSELINEACFEYSPDGIEYKKCTYRADGSTLQLFITCPENVHFIRYAWTNYGKVMLFGRNGLPLAPFNVRL